MLVKVAQLMARKLKIVTGEEKKKDQNTNTITRYMSRSESRKRITSPIYESRSQRVKLSDEEKLH